jgi:hypothetical protein
MYTEREIKKILSRAFELQNRSEGIISVEEADHKLTLEEIEEVARDSGLSPEYVRQAAIEFEGIPIEEPLFLDTGDSYEVELIGFAKGKVNKKTWAELRSIIEYHFDSPGKVKRRPNGIVWKAQPKGILKFLKTRKSPEIEVSTSGIKTTIRLKKSLKTIQKLLLYPSFAALGGAAVILGITFMEGPEGLFFIAGLMALAKLFHYWAASKKDKAREALKDAMEQLLTIVTRRHTAAERKDILMDEKAKITLQEMEVEATDDPNRSDPTRQKTNG